MPQFLDVAREGVALIVTMNRPEERNAIPDVEACREFEQVCNQAESDPALSVMILTGAGSAFSAGGNLKMMLQRDGFAPRETPLATRNSYRDSIQRIARSLYELEIPTIAAINGPAIGAGLDMALMCDMRIASQAATFAESFVKVGLVPGDGGAWLLPRAVGMAKAAEMTFTGEALNAQQALDCGLVSRVVPSTDLMDAALELAGKVGVNPRTSLRFSKRLLREGQAMSFKSLLELSAGFQAILHETEDHKEALESILNQRSPKFKGC